MTTCVLLSGGIDSMVVLSLIRRRNRDVTAVFIDYGQAALTHERAASRSLADYFETELLNVRIVLPKSYGAGEIRHRNGALIFAAAMATAGVADCIAIGVHTGVPYQDCSPAFIASIDAALKASHPSQLQLIAPLSTWKKSEILAYAKRESLPINLTYSCEEGGDSPCGKCASCLDRVGL